MHYNRNNNFLGLFIAVLFTINLGCEQKGKISNVKYSNDYKEEILKLRADSLYGIDDYKNAVFILNDLIEIDQRNGEYYYKKAYSLSQLNQYEESVKNYSQAADLKYREKDCYYNMGVIYSIVFLDDSIALINLKKSLVIEPNSPKIILMINEIETLQK